MSDTSTDTSDPDGAHRAILSVTDSRPDPADPGPDRYDVIVIGAGSTGTNVAGEARRHGLSVAVIEAELVGGECSYWACMPAKALLGPPQALVDAERHPGTGKLDLGPIDADAVLAQRNDRAAEFDDGGQVDWVESVGADLIRGRARLAGTRLVDVTIAGGAVRRLRAERAVVIATGSGATIPPIDGLDRTRFWTNREATSAASVPGRLVVLGGGPVGCELAQAWRRLGAEVVLVEREERLVADYPEWAGERLARALADDGIDVRTGVTASAVERSDQGSGPVRVHLDGGGDPIEADELLVAVGRSPRTDDLGLETVGLEAGGFLDVDDRLAVRDVEGSWLYAAGDVNGRALLTHQGKYQARCLGAVLGGVDTPAWADHVAVPQVVFTDPQLAAVGRIRTGDDPALREVTVDLGQAAGAVLAGRTDGTAAIVVDDERGFVVGACLAGPGVGELIHAATIAITAEVPIDRLWHAVPAFPTMSEIWLRLLEAERSGRADPSV